MLPSLGLVREGDTAMGVLLYVAGFITVLRMDGSRERARGERAQTAID
jgi:hypothetical protein